MEVRVAVDWHADINAAVHALDVDISAKKTDGNHEAFLGMFELSAGSQPRHVVSVGQNLKQHFSTELTHRERPSHVAEGPLQHVHI